MHNLADMGLQPQPTLDWVLGTVHIQFGFPKVRSDGGYHVALLLLRLEMCRLGDLCHTTG